jgi:hypothetical protein
MRKWKLGTKLFTGSIVSLLLSMGLCGAGFTLEGGASALQQFEMGAGLVLLAGSAVLFVAAIIAWLSKYHGRQ